MYIQFNLLKLNDAFWTGKLEVIGLKVKPLLSQDYEDLNLVEISDSYSFSLLTEVERSTRNH